MQVKVGDVLLVGTAHVSPDSVKEVKEAIESFKPDVVAVELCRSRYKVLTEKRKWEETPITSFLSGGKAYLLLAQTFLSSIQRRIGKELGSEPGAEMVAAIEEAKKIEVEVALVDRDISITLKRAWRKMGFREKLRLAWEFIKAMIGYDEDEEFDIKELMEQDVISTMMEEFGKIAPSTTEVLINERDKYIAKRILDEKKKGKVLAVVGAGHLQGIKHYLEKGEVNVDIKSLENVPKKRVSVAKIVAYAVPILFVSIVVWILVTSGLSSLDKILDMFLWWFLINGSLSATGAAIARGHPLSILTAFVAAPFTSLNPAVAAGWFAGIVEAKLRMPTVKDFQQLNKVEGLKDFLNNRVIRLLMVVALANLGSTIGTLVAIPYIIKIGLIG
ncbi:MAG TPA: TraB/GumN family protein [Thermoplasmatales archaeon]|nr:TraB/GumN family protein [Thermoplasmatales archaeon]